jgi:ABC-type glycerol-3-phosphate transport system substrate-binding protein
MKLVKISIVALSMGLFLASCGGNTEATAPVEEVVAPVVDSAAAMVDSAAAPAAEAPATH